MFSNRVFNFNPGPAALPTSVLEEVRQELLNYRGTGMSVMEMSHRSPEFEEIITSTASLMLEIMGLNNDYHVLFLQGGASLQFAMIPLNFLHPGQTADYIITGNFAERAWQEARRIGQTHVAASTKEEGFKRIPRQEELNFSQSPAYIHITTNNTIFGTQWKYIPECGQAPLVADMSSDILSREMDLSRFSLIYAGAQKNLGPAGVTAVVIKKELLERATSNLPQILSYKVHAEANSLYNTPPCFAVYIVGLVLKWIKKKGGLKKIEEENKKKAALLYQVIDESGGFYRGHADKESRSTMNVTFRLPDEKTEKAFLEGAAAEGLVGLKGHRSVGGIRASLYNAVPLEGCKALALFMKDFRQKKG